ncbi:MAG: histidine phosphatase family protein [Rhodospirillales bacterium]
MRTLYLLRHAKSSWSDPSLDDVERPLNSRGKEARDVIADWFRRNRIRPDLVICSPAKRTRQTLKPIRKLWDPCPGIIFEPKVYEASAGDLHDVLRHAAPNARSILLVGHNPGLQSLAADLMDDSMDGPARQLRAKFPTGAIACLTADKEGWMRMSGGAFRLRDFVLPRLLAAA